MEILQFWAPKMGITSQAVFDFYVEKYPAIAAKEESKAYVLAPCCLLTLDKYGWA